MKLKPCPICKTNNHLRIKTFNEWYKWYVECEKCVHIFMGTSDRDETIEKYNEHQEKKRRASEGKS